MTEQATSQRTWAARIWQQARHATWANRWPALWLQVFGVALLLSYYWLPATAGIWDTVSHWKSHWGIGFAIVSTAIAGGLVPFCAQGLQRGKRPDYRLSSLVFAVGFWAAKGIEVDLLYTVQTRIWGDEPTLFVIIAKVLGDQLIYAPLIAVPDMLLGFAWKEHGYSFRRLWRAMSWRWFIDRAAPLTVMNWLVWIPAVAMIYLLPLPLQLPAQNLVLCFWSLVLLVAISPPDTPSTD